jgi:hypothetical protein
MDLIFSFFNNYCAGLAAAKRLCRIEQQLQLPAQTQVTHKHAHLKLPSLFNLLPVPPTAARQLGMLLLPLVQLLPPGPCQPPLLLLPVLLTPLPAPALPLLLRMLG